MITTEILPAKATAARVNLEQAGLTDLVEIRVGDARETLAEPPRPVDMLVLDGRNDLYVPILELVLPRLTPGAIILAHLGIELTVKVGSD